MGRLDRKGTYLPYLDVGAYLLRGACYEDLVWIEGKIYMKI